LAGTPTICFPVEHEMRLVTIQPAVSLTSTVAGTPPPTKTYNATTRSRLFVFFSKSGGGETETGTLATVLRRACLHLMGMEDMGVRYCRNPQPPNRDLLTTCRRKLYSAPTVTASAISPFSSPSTSNPGSPLLQRTGSHNPRIPH